METDLFGDPFGEDEPEPKRRRGEEIGLAKGKRINRAILQQLFDAGVKLTTPASKVLPKLRALRNGPAIGTDPATWEGHVLAIERWVESFGALDVWHELENSGGNREALIYLHQKTLPDLRAKWTNRMGVETHPPEEDE